MAACRNCRFLYGVNRDVAPDRGKCEVWECWQKLRSNACRHYEPKDWNSNPSTRRR